ncbi:MAG: hypothetical protein JSS81_16235 [Acidobacteria bacterium]|nr:hypothetical protein [Acidobacteriota bacterium]
MKKFLLAVLISTTIAGLALSFTAQTRPPVKKNVRETPTPTPTATPAEAVTVKTPPAKKNERPTNNNSSDSSPQTDYTPTYFYEFSQPAFTVSKILIEHDERGRGKISFMKSVSNELITDPLQVSEAALKRIDDALTALDFFNSTENYQYEKDYQHLGNTTFKITKNGRTRETKFNWTTNPNAKTLADEYRKIANQAIWIFDMNLARENQPLNAPQMVDGLDGYLRRGEISDPAQLLPYLREVGNDERIPLIARNHAKRIAEKIESEKK